MQDHSVLGIRYTCYSCAQKFYDLNRPKAICPSCEADQIDTPALVISKVSSGLPEGNITEAGASKEEGDDAGEGKESQGEGFGDFGNEGEGEEGEGEGEGEGA
jgi:hypothetical protein